MQTLTSTFSKIINEENNKQNKTENNQKELPNLKDNNFDNNINNKVDTTQEENKNNTNNIINSQQSKDFINSFNFNEILNYSPSTKALIDYIIKVNESLREQLKNIKMYIEIQKVFVSIIYQNVESFIQSISQSQIQSQAQKPHSTNKDVNSQNSQNNQNNNIASQIKEINSQSNQNNNNAIPKISPASQLNVNNLNNLVSPSNSNSSLINSPNLNYNSPIIISPMSQILSSYNNLGKGLSLFNYPNQQFKQDINIPNILNGRIPFPLPQQQGVNLAGNPIITLNMPQMIPILNQMNVIGNNSINNSLQFVNNNQKNNQVSK